MPTTAPTNQNSCTTPPTHLDGQCQQVADIEAALHEVEQVRHVLCRREELGRPRRERRHELDEVFGDGVSHDMLAVVGELLEPLEQILDVYGGVRGVLRGGRSIIMITNKYFNYSLLLLLF